MEEQPNSLGWASAVMSPGARARKAAGGPPWAGLALHLQVERLTTAETVPKRRTHPVVVEGAREARTGPEETRVPEMPLAPEAREVAAGAEREGARTQRPPPRRPAQWAVTITWDLVEEPGIVPAEEPEREPMAEAGAGDSVPSHPLQERMVERGRNGMPRTDRGGAERARAASPLTCWEQSEEMARFMAEAGAREAMPLYAPMPATAALGHRESSSSPTRQWE